jgi:hypothetical protein
MAICFAHPRVITAVINKPDEKLPASICPAPVFHIGEYLDNPDFVDHAIPEAFRPISTVEKREAYKKFLAEWSVYKKLAVVMVWDRFDLRDLIQFHITQLRTYRHDKVVITAYVATHAKVHDSAHVDDIEREYINRFLQDCKGKLVFVTGHCGCASESIDLLFAPYLQHVDVKKVDILVSGTFSYEA